LISFSDETYGHVKQELRDDLSSEVSRTTTPSSTTSRAQETIKKLQSTLEKNHSNIVDDNKQRAD
jgi:hypothetical protein